MRRADMWSPAEEAWLREVYPHHHNAEIAEMHAQAFSDRPRRTEKAINSRAKVYKLRKAEGFVRNPPTFWTPEKVEWFRAYVPGRSEREISAEHERLYGEPLTESQIGNAKDRFNVRSGTVGGRFRKGMAPANKGKTWAEYGTPEGHERSRATQFKKGGMPHNAVDKPIGSERTDPDGYVLVKVAERPSSQDRNDNWVLKQRLVYEREVGPIPEGCMIVFADHDKSNFDPGNLVAVPRDLWSAISRRHIAYYDAESLNTAMLIARVDRARYAAQCRPRACKRCGAEFKPRFANQRTCDACLGR